MQYKNSNYEQHKRAEGISVSRLFQMGYNEITRYELDNKSLIIAKIRKDETKTKKIYVYAFFSRGFKTKQAAINRIWDSKLYFWNLESFTANTEFWIVDKYENIIRIMINDLKPHEDVLNEIIECSRGCYEH